jgi:hypothetical protein
MSQDHIIRGNDVMDRAGGGHNGLHRGLATVVVDDDDDASGDTDDGPKRHGRLRWERRVEMQLHLVRDAVAHRADLDRLRKAPRVSTDPVSGSCLGRTRVRERDAVVGTVGPRWAGGRRRRSHGGSGDPSDEEKEHGRREDERCEHDDDERSHRRFIEALTPGWERTLHAIVVASV